VGDVLEFSRRLADEEMTDEDIMRERADLLLSQDPPEHTRLRRLLAPHHGARWAQATSSTSQAIRG
jgi:cytochrome P450